MDKSYNKGNKVMDPAYNPKVATWGVFERPANISEAYGGGRTIKAGTPLEDATVTQARKDRIAAALSRYSRSLLPVFCRFCGLTSSTQLISAPFTQTTLCLHVTLLAIARSGKVQI